MTANAVDGNTGNRNKCHRLFSQNRLLVLLICLIIFGVIVGVLLFLLIPALLTKEPRPYRLPTNIVPYEYGLEIKPYLAPGDFWFEGQVVIYVTCARSTDSIVLHSKNLTLEEDSIRVTTLEGDLLKVLVVNYDIDNDLLILRTLDDLKVRNSYRIYIKYKASFSEERRGFYISSYEDDENVTHYVASTQLEPVKARLVFPCFDEPQLKSTFNVTLVRWKNMTSLSNMPKLRTENRGGNWVADVYEKSMKMSTYLVAFVFCDYVSTKKGLITIWSPKHRKHNAEYAMNVSHTSLRFFESKLERKYPGPKLDMVPIPPYTTAMENWGLIIYDFDSLLTPENKTDETANTYIEIAAVVSHEIAHHWFGNLVTLKWWSDLWLNEGMTTYMEHLARAELLPAWHQVDTTIASVYEILPSDCSKSDPIWRPVYSSKDASRNFDSATYRKGAMVTRMAHQILGEDAFWKGIRRYINVNEYDNVEEADLWRSLTLAQPGKERLNMAEIMHPWTHLSGVPVVTVKRDYKKGTASISQQSCLSDSKEHEEDLWNIPIIFETKYDIDLFDKITWLKTRNMTLEGMPDELQWVMANGDSTGYYLVNYDRENWKLITKQLLLNHNIFEPTERFKIVTELKLLVKMEIAEIDLFFESILYIPEETQYEILATHIEFLFGYIYHFSEDQYLSLMREFIIYAWKNMYDKYGWVEKDGTKRLTWEETMMSRTSIMALCHLEYGPCLDEAFNLYSMLRNNETTMNKREDAYSYVALCTALRNATYEEWSEIKDIHFNDESDNLSFALSCCKEASIIREEITIEDAKSSAIFRLMSPFMVWDSSFNEYLNFVDEHFDEITEEGFEVSKWRMEWINNGMGISKIRKMKEVFSKHLKDMSGSGAENMESFLEYLNERLPILEKKADILKKWLDRKPWRQIL